MGTWEERMGKKNGKRRKGRWEEKIGKRKREERIGKSR
jgi:hypothetical protein